MSRASPGCRESQPPPLGTAQEVFTEQCGSCHTLEAAGSAGTTGPVLDDVLPGQAAEEIMNSIQDPEADIASGFPAGVMPVFDETRLPEANLNALVQYLLACTEDPSGDDCTTAAEQSEADAPEPAGQAAGGNEAAARPPRRFPQPPPPGPPQRA